MKNQVKHMCCGSHMDSVVTDLHVVFLCVDFSVSVPFPLVQYLCYFYCFITSISNFTAQTVLRLRMSHFRNISAVFQTLLGFKAQMAPRSKSQVWMVLLFRPGTLSLGCDVEWSHHRLRPARVNMKGLKHGDYRETGKVFSPTDHMFLFCFSEVRTEIFNWFLPSTETGSASDWGPNTFIFTFMHLADAVCVTYRG